MSFSRGWYSSHDAAHRDQAADALLHLGTKRKAGARQAAHLLFFGNGHWGIILLLLLLLLLLLRNFLLFLLCFLPLLELLPVFLLQQQPR